MPSISGHAMSPCLHNHEEKTTSSDRRNDVGSSKSEFFDQQHGQTRGIKPTMAVNHSSFNAFAKQNSQFSLETPYMLSTERPGLHSNGLMPGMNAGQHLSFQPVPHFQNSNDSIRELCMLEKQLFEYDPSSGYTDGIIHAASEAYKSAYRLAEHHHKMHLVYLQEADNILMQYQMDKKAEQNRMMGPSSMPLNSIQQHTALTAGVSNALNSSFVNIPGHFISQIENSSNVAMNVTSGMSDVSNKRPFTHTTGNETYQPVSFSQKKPRHSSPHDTVPDLHQKNEKTVSPSDSEKSSNTANAELFQNESEIVEKNQVEGEDDTYSAGESLNSNEENTASTMITQFGFDHFYKELCRYYDDYGHLNVPKKLKLRTNPLYLFIREVQQIALKKGNKKDDDEASNFLTEEHMSLLKSIGFPFLNSDNGNPTDIDNSSSSLSNHEKSPDEV
jgi:hypothetical protein